MRSSLDKLVVEADCSVVGPICSTDTEPAAWTDMTRKLATDLVAKPRVNGLGVIGTIEPVQANRPSRLNRSGERWRCTTRCG